ncbi:hypothetical protein MVES1_001401 [Malassezia vespertilionis]|uniref:Uncharacterized protein n=1 Tax=Malassezia vespertilionis TaxID=2020962 RepID=A0A2N1JEH4_9BASI|nr:uncharacterized protein MVES1_001401 [Malassezia vespertilionis]PKI84916.1 hypothetical protein MVES_001321 [Malassezia vespertilionis]WFD06062.1 hypothetical protein MVES1_001401 [Malassezia vespertilionis]
MEAAAALRKARIDALRALRAAEEASDADALAQNTFGAEVKRAFRESVPPPGYVRPTTVIDTVEQAIAGLQERTLGEDATMQTQELDLHAIAPQKPNADLRRDYMRRVEKLERRTKHAIRTLIVQRLGTQDEAAHAEAVSLVAGMESEEEEG